MHVSINDFCDICGDEMLTDEEFIILVGNEDSTAFRAGLFIAGYPGKSATDSVTVSTEGSPKSPIRWLDHRKDAWDPQSVTACRYPFRFCDPEHPIEAATLHRDCLQLVMRQCKGAGSQNLGYQDILEMIWILAVWREPFPDVAQPLRLPRSSLDRSRTLTSLPAFGLVVTRFVFPRGEPLPSEIWDMILQESRSALIWRYVVVLDFCSRLLSLPRFSSPCSVPFDKVKTWAKGFDLVTSESSHKGIPEDIHVPPPFVLLTVDMNGLQRIERLEERPVHQPKEPGADSMAYVIESQDQLDDATIQCRFGLPRLRFKLEPAPGLVRSVPTFTIWDTPTPPHLTKRVRPWRDFTRRLFTIDVDPDTAPEPLTGLTFFVSRDDSQILGIHAHSKKSPSASRSFMRLNPPRRENLMWIYVPIAADDRSIAFNDLNPVPTDELASDPGPPDCIGEDWDVYRAGSCILLPINSKRKTTIHRYANASFRLQKPSNPQPPLALQGSTLKELKTLVYELRYGDPVSWMTGLFTTGADATITWAAAPADLDYYPKGLNALPDHRPQLPSDSWKFMASAPLDAVAWVKVFPDPGSPYCNGILLGYDNGKQLAVGQCRIGLDSHEVEVDFVERPGSFCLANFVIELAHPTLPAAFYALRPSKSEIHFHHEGFHVTGPHGHGGRGNDPESEEWECHTMSGELNFLYRGGDRTSNCGDTTWVMVEPRRSSSLNVTSW